MGMYVRYVYPASNGLFFLLELVGDFSVDLPAT